MTRRRGFSRRYWDAKAEASRRYLALRSRRRSSLHRRGKSNIVGVALGTKSTAGRNVGRNAVIVLVEKKVSAENLDPSMRVPEEIAGVETDVVEAGRFRKLAGPAFPNPQQPLRPGCSLAFEPPPPGTVSESRISGTLGVIVRGAKDEKRYVLSNNHVLAGEGHLKRGWPIVQPGPADSGGNVVASLANWLRLSATVPNLADCAIAELGDGIDWSHDAMDARGTMASGTPRSPTKGAGVCKVGRTTGYRVGYIFSPSADVDVDGYDAGTLHFQDQILIGSIGNLFGDEGDSGSLVLDYMTSRPVGLLFATSGQFAAATALDVVFDLLRVRL